MNHPNRIRGVPKRPRSQGIMLFEVLIAFAFMAVATAFTLKMHQSRLEYERVSTDRLRNQLAVENVAEQLANVPYSEIGQSAPELAKTSSVDISVEEFDSGPTVGIHVTIRVDSDGVPVTHHVWRLEPKS